MAWKPTGSYTLKIQDKDKSRNIILRTFFQLQRLFNNEREVDYMNYELITILKEVVMPCFEILFQYFNEMNLGSTEYEPSEKLVTKY